jgi:dCMP deaminase
MPEITELNKRSIPDRLRYFATYLRQNAGDDARVTENVALGLDVTADDLERERAEKRRATEQQADDSGLIVWDDYFLAIARTVALRADCTHRRVGAVLVQDNRVISTGFNGALPRQISCLSGGCPRGRHYKVHFDSGDICACGGVWPCSQYAEPGSDYANCIAIHAEARAILHVGWSWTEYATMYCTDEPCCNCEKLIRTAGIARFVTPQGVKNWAVAQMGDM